MAFRVNGGTYPALTKALGVRGQTTLQVSVLGITHYSPAAAGVLAFTNMPFAGYEGGTLSFSVARNSGATGTIAVDWAMTVSEGTPSPAAGTISWNNGEAGTKSVLVQPGVVAVDRVGTITLSNPRSLSGGAAPTISGATQSFTIQNDATGPSEPTIGTPTNVNASGMTIPLAFGSIDNQSGVLDHALERAQGSGSTSFAQVAQGPSIFPYPATGLSASTLFRWRARGRNRAGIYSIYSNIVEGTTGSSSSDNDGLIVTNWANWDTDAAQIISLDVNTTIPRKASNGASNSFDPAGAWWNGNTGVMRFYPPTTSSDSYSAFGDIPFWKNATKTINQINIRLEYMMSAAFCADGVNHPKFLIIRIYPNRNNSSPGTPVRPMLFLENMLEANNASIDLHNALFMCHSQNTFRYFSSTNRIPGPVQADYDAAGGDDQPTGGPGPARGAIMRQPFYHGQVAGADLGGNPIIAASEVVIVEMRVNVLATADEPNGIIAYRLYRRNGQVFERGCSWLWEAVGKTVGPNNFIADLDVCGGGYYNGANANPGLALWTAMGRRMTFGFNLQPTVGRYWMGPPVGYVQV